MPQLAVWDNFRMPRRIMGSSRALGLADRIAGHAVAGDFHRLDETVGVELHLVDADDAVVAAAIVERPPVIDDVPLAGRGRAQHRVVTRAGRDGGILLEDLP